MKQIPAKNFGKLDDFIGNINRNGLSYPSRYIVIFGQNIGNSLQAVYGLGLDNQRLSMMCTDIDIPGIALKKTELEIYGPNQVYPTAPVYVNESVMDFNLSKDHYERVFFENWYDYIYKRDVDNKTGQPTYSMNYPDEYMTTIEMYQIDKGENKGNLTINYGVILNDVFVSQISPINLGHNKTDTISKIQVYFSYRSWNRINLNNFYKQPFTFNNAPNVNGNIKFRPIPTI